MALDPCHLIGSQPTYELKRSSSNQPRPAYSRRISGAPPANASTDFQNILQAAVKNRNSGNAHPAPPSVKPAGAGVLALAQQIQLELTEHLCEAISMAESPGEPDVADEWSQLQDLLPNDMAGHGVPSTTRRVPSEKRSLEPSELNALIGQAATAYGVDPDLIHGVIQAESNFDPKALSPKGAMGLMQLMPETAKDLKVTDPYDARSNIMGGTQYLKTLMDHYGGDIPSALAAYNWGMGNLDRHPDQLPDETRDYVRKVTKIYLKRKDGIA